MKYLIILCLCLGILSSEERSLQLEHVQQGDKQTLSGSHYFVTHLSQNTERILSVYTTQDAMSVYEKKQDVGYCSNYQLEQLNPEKTSIRITHKVENQTSVYTLLWDSNGKLEVLSEDKLVQSHLASIVAKTSLYITDKKDLESHLLRIAVDVSDIAMVLYPNKIKSSKRPQKIQRQWRIEKSSGDSSIYLSVKNMKLIDFSIFVTDKSSNVKFASVRGKIISDNVLKVSVGQMTYYGKGYWLKGSAYLICQ